MLQNNFKHTNLIHKYMRTQHTHKYNMTTAVECFIFKISGACGNEIIELIEYTKNTDTEFQINGACIAIAN